LGTLSKVLQWIRSRCFKVLKIGQGNQNSEVLSVTRVLDPLTRIATFTISFPPSNPPETYFDTNVWVGMNSQDIANLETLKRVRGFRYRYSITNYVELLSRLGRGPAPGWDNPFALVRAAFRKMKHLCDAPVLPSPEMEYLHDVGLGRLIDPVWVPNAEEIALAVDLITHANTLADITGSGIQTVRPLRFSRWVIDPAHYYGLTQTDEESARHRIEDLYNALGREIQRNNLEPLSQWFIKLATFFLLFRPSQRRATMQTLTPEEQNQFLGGFTRGAGRLFNAHVTFIAVKTLNFGHRIDPNDLYDALQLLSLRDENRLFITNENGFFRYREADVIHRVVKWDGFRMSNDPPR
jgi:hypothetical protein